MVPKQGGHSRSTSMKSQTALLWLSDYAEKYAEKLTNLAELHLPPCFNKASVYETYVEETEMESEPISMSHFYLLWRNCLNHVNIPKVN